MPGLDMIPEAYRWAVIILAAIVIAALPWLALMQLGWLRKMAYAPTNGAPAPALAAKKGEGAEKILGIVGGFAAWGAIAALYVFAGKWMDLAFWSWVALGLGLLAMIAAMAPTGRKKFGMIAILVIVGLVIYGGASAFEWSRARHPGTKFPTSQGIRP